MRAKNVHVIMHFKSCVSDIYMHQIIFDIAAMDDCGIIVILLLGDAL